MLKFLTSGLLILIMLASCTTTTMTLDEAKKISVSMEQEPVFVPPPRRINDITAILDQPGRDVPETTKKLQELVNTAPPENANKRMLMNFYRRRGHAAYELGLLKQAREDLTNALQLSQELDIEQARTINFWLSKIEKDTGNIRYAKELIEKNLENPRGSGDFSVMINIYSNMGDVDGATRTRIQLKEYCAKQYRLYGKKGKGSGAKKVTDERLLWCDINEAGSDGHIFNLKGQYSENEAKIREGINKLNSIKDKNPYEDIRWRIMLSKNLKAQGRFIDAEIEVRRALEDAIRVGGKDSVGTGMCVSTLANILLSQGRIQEAEILFGQAIKIYERSGIANNSTYMITARIGMMGCLSLKKEFSRALEQYNLIKAGIAHDEYFNRRNIYENRSIPILLIRTGQAEEALQISTNAYNRFRSTLGENNYGTAEFLALRAMANHRMNNINQALKDFSGSIEVLTASPPDSKDYLKNHRLKIIIDDYLRLIDKTKGTDVERNVGIDAVSTAFRLSELSRGSTVLSAFVASSARAAERDPEAADLMRKEQDAARQVKELEEALIENLSAPPDQQNREIIKNLNIKLEALRQARLTMLEEIVKRSPKYRDFVKPKIPTIPDVQKKLNNGEALLSIYTTSDRTYVFAIPKTGQARYHSINTGEDDLDKLIAPLRRSLDPKPQTFGDIPGFDLNISYKLFKDLILPVNDGIKDASGLLIIVNNPINSIPIATLITAPYESEKTERLLFESYKNAPWLIRNYSITMLPSASFLVTLRNLPKGDEKRKAFIGFGDPVFNLAQEGIITPPSKERSSVQVRGVRITAKGELDSDKIASSRLENLNRLPDTSEEIKDISLTLGANTSQDVFLRKDASEHTVKTQNLSNRKVVAFATHALVPGDLDGLDQPAIALSSPTVTKDREDGLLTMGEIMKLTLNADWVVLSACNTGASEGSGNEALSGLGRAFFYAGTRALLVSLYPVETTAARKLTTNLFRYQLNDKTLTRAQALKKTMLDLINDPGITDASSKKIVASYAHPLFWAPFIVVGDGGR